MKPEEKSETKFEIDLDIEKREQDRILDNYFGDYDLEVHL